MMKKTFDYFRANPSGNITGFVLWPVYPGYRKAYADAIMEQIDSEVEQVGFISPSYDGPPLRLDMMGGEFCANATRAYGLYAATFENVKDDLEMEVYVSGVNGPMIVETNVNKGTAYVEMESPISIGEVEFDGSSYKVIELTGITHTIVPGTGDEKKARDIIEKVKKKIDSKAYGVMFVDEDKLEMVPYVYVVGTDTLIREGSCGSGTTALAHYLNRNKDKNFNAIIKQPKGEIEIKTRSDEDGLHYLIGGKVELGEKQKVTIDIPKEVVQEISAKHKKELEEEKLKEKEYEYEEE